MPKYKVISMEDDTIKIEKTDFKVEFATKEVKEHYENLQKALKECEAKISLEEATQTNIINNHSEVKELKEEIKQACYLLIKSILDIQPFVQRSQQITKALKEYDEELEEIKKQTEIDILK